MKRLILITVFIFSLVAAYSYADNEGHMMGSGMMSSPGYGETKESGQSLDYRMMGQGGYGMGPGMMGGGMMGPGMMGYGGYGMMGRGMSGYGMSPCMMGQGGYGMMGRGMMGYGMGPGMMGGGMMGQGMMGGGMMGPGMGYSYGSWGYNQEAYKKYMDETAGLRKEMHNKKFEYFEALRNPDTKRETIMKHEKEIQDLKKKIYEKWQK